MGTILEITLAEDGPGAGEALAAAFAEAARLEKLLTAHERAAPLAELNLNGVLRDPPEVLVRALSRALKMARLTGGAFNPAVGPVVELFRRNPSAGSAELSALAPLLSWEGVSLSKNRIALMVPGMSLTLDAMAKGFIIDKISEKLTRLGFDRHLVSAGGDILASGERPGGGPWRCAVADPKGTGGHLAVVGLNNQAVATSNDFESLKRGYRHLVGPRRHRGVIETGPKPLSATVVAPSAELADALATTLAVSPAHLVPGLVEGFLGVSGLLLWEDGEVTEVPSLGLGRSWAGE
jgi:thiamine biosynthesis lipoprotein